jgi:hypothetical protein
LEKEIMKYAVYKRVQRILPAPSPQFSIEIENHLGTFGDKDEAIRAALLHCDSKNVFVREVP